MQTRYIVGEADGWEWGISLISVMCKGACILWVRVMCKGADQVYCGLGLWMGIMYIMG